MSAPLHADSFLLLAAFCLFATLLFLEKRRPVRRFSGNGLKASFSTNASAFLVNNVIMNLLSVSSLLVVAGAYSHHGLLGGVADGPWKWAISFVLFDFVVYAWHYCGHRFEALWRFHKIHHSDKSFHVTTGLRFHVFDQLLEVIVKCAATVVIGADAHVVVLGEIARMLFVLFHHANIAIPGERFLSYLIITPYLHRTHHSTRRSEHDSNYGIVLAIWDILFRTRKEVEPKSIGLELIEAQNLLQLFSLAFLTERRLARVLHLLPRKSRHVSQRI
jgi:sterol desaturase/sphingolipid hydroxylase (fatty acid hydroxylase superfamily)